MSEEFFILGYFALVIFIWTLGCWSISRSNSYYRDSNYLPWTLISICFPVLLLMIPVVIHEYLLKRRVAKGDPYIMPYGVCVFEKDLNNPKRLEKKFFGRNAGTFPFIVTEEDILRFKDELKNLKREE